MTKTSLSHPLQIAEISADPTLGQIGITFCPGKYDLQTMPGAWKRDISLDLDVIRDCAGGWNA
jgi:ADP-ribosyl-[dinitrogen reductase] hydrolase